MGKYLSKEQILAAADLKQEAVAVPEWGGDVLLRSLTGEERDSFEGSVVAVEGKRTVVNSKHLRAKLVALCAVDEEGKKIFSEEDVLALSRKNASPLERLFVVARRLAGMSERDVDELEAGLRGAQAAS